MKNKIDDLRNHLFATLEALQDKDNPMELERAKAVAGVAQVIVNSAKVECDFIKLTGTGGSGFVPQEPRLEAPPQDQAPGTPRLVHGKAQTGSK